MGAKDALVGLESSLARQFESVLAPDEQVLEVVPGSTDEALVLTSTRVHLRHRRGLRMVPTLSSWPIAAVVDVSVRFGALALRVQDGAAGGSARASHHTISLSRAPGAKDAASRVQRRLKGEPPTPVTSDNAGSAENRVAIVCIGCGAGVNSHPTSTTYSCAGCGGRYLLFRCPHCHADTHVHPQAVGKPGTCSSCGRQSKWDKWAQSPTTFGAVASNLGISQEEAADPDRRDVWGVVVAATGLTGLGSGVGCSLTFTRDAVVIRSYDKIGRSASVTAIPQAEIRLLRIAGRGAITNTSGGGWMGGGFGAQGIVEGVLLAGALNALTTRSTTTLETLVHLGAGPRELLLLNSTVAPEVLQIRLAPAFSRIDSAQAQEVLSTPPSSRPIRLAQELEALASLRDRGVLTPDEFERAKTAALRDHEATT